MECEHKSRVTEGIEKKDLPGKVEKGQRFFVRYFRSIATERELLLDCRCHCFSRDPLEPLAKTLFELT